MGAGKFYVQCDLQCEVKLGSNKSTIIISTVTVSVGNSQERSHER